MVGELGFMVLQTQDGPEGRDVTVLNFSPDTDTITVRYPLSSGLGSTGFGSLKLRRYGTSTYVSVGYQADLDIREYIYFGELAEQHRRELAVLKRSSPLASSIFKSAF